jgi:NAD(P)H-hydrate epimerase
MQCKEAGVEFKPHWRPESEDCLVIDSIFGFSFHGEIREPFREVIEYLKTRNQEQCTLAVDIPSGWQVDEILQKSKSA